MKDMKMIDIMI